LLTRVVVLASGSPRRLALLRLAGMDVRVVVPNVDEDRLGEQTPAQMVARLAHLKANTVAVAHPHEVVIAADTTVALGQRIFNKPANDDDARAMLQALAGETHSVLTGVCLCRPGREPMLEVEQTRVKFRVLSKQDIDAYLLAGEHHDKAGAYGVQAAGSVLVERVEGCITNVVGLPMPRLLRMMGDT
jgi:septum formation protein